MAKHPDVLILGGGIIGLTTAWYLAGEGCSVTLLERGEVGREASWAGAGILPPGNLAHARTAMDRLRAHSAALHPDLARQLREETGLENGFVVCGGIEVPDPEDPGAHLPTEEWHAEGVPYEILDRSGLERREPALAQVITRGVWIPGIAQVRNPWHLKALETGCRVRGVKIHPQTPIEQFVTERNRVVGVVSRTSRHAADQVLVAAGAWSGQLLGLLGFTPPVKPIRGQMVLFDTRGTGVRPILMQGKRYLVPRTDGRLLAGSTEEDVGFDAAPTEAGVAGLIAFARRLVPALNEAPIEKTWAGLRPCSPDEKPYLGQVPGWENLHVAAGHFRAGLLLSPATGRVMTQHLTGQSPLVSLEEFSLRREGAAQG